MLVQCRNEMTMEELFPKRPYVGYPHLSHEENSSPVVDRTWVQQHMFYHSPAYQQAMLAGAHNIQAFHGMYAGGRLNEHIQADESSSSLSEQSSKHPVEHSNGKTPLAGVLSDEDLLDMVKEPLFFSLCKCFPLLFHRFSIILYALVICLTVAFWKDYYCLEL